MKLIKSLRKYTGVISTLYLDIYRYTSIRVGKISLYSFLGPTIQISALLIMLMLVKNDSKYADMFAQYLHIQEYSQFITINVGLIIFLLLLSAYMIYEAEKNIAIVVKDYVDHKLSSLFTDANRLGDCKQSLAELYSKLRYFSRHIEIASRRLLYLPSSLLNTLYSILLLMYVDPVLALLLGVIALPVLFPMKKLALEIVKFEKVKNRLTREAGSDFHQFAHDMGCQNVNRSTEGVHRAYRNTALSRVNTAVQGRLINKARSRGLMNLLFVLVVAVSAVYILTLHGMNQEVLAYYLVFFVALRMSLISSRKLASQLTNYSRFYQCVCEFLSMFVDRKPPDASARLAPLEQASSITLNNDEEGSRTVHWAEKGRLQPVICQSRIDYIYLHSLGCEIRGLCTPELNVVPKISFFSFEKLNHLARKRSSTVAALVESGLTDDCEVLLLEREVLDALDHETVGKLINHSGKTGLPVLVTHQPDAFHSHELFSEALLYLSARADIGFVTHLQQDDEQTGKDIEAFILEQKSRNEDVDIDRFDIIDDEDDV